ncbi:SlyX protein [Bordetella genomosp. 5]|uniref:SlyX protein n=1 Tax=Bordetella genomosp. 5 TaxID=1395608 RepID=A0A261T860_9BORD|nr:SlyX family protein [Bordetella genomosp. 5]OZI45615.1 hypothetical protein CAL25_20445 [Bordetella genomosp. 5]OZI46250.1 SlyX protein [Bordetella genomosp. 5]
MTSTDTSSPDALQQTQERLTELEIKFSFAEDLLDSLNTIIARQQQQIEALAREVHDLREQGRNAPSAPRSLLDEVPPHY